MKLPFAAELPAPLRSISRRLAGPELRARIAADIQHLAHLQSRRHPLFARSTTALRGMRNQHRGESCVIIGNGPSIADEDLSKLTGVTTFCLNRGYLLWREQGLKPTYLVAVNDLVLEQFHEELVAVGRPLFVPWQYHDLFASAEGAIFLEMRWHKRFFDDVTNGLWPGATVTFAAMQLAYHMGFSRVVLIGVDHRFADKGKPHQEVVQAGDDKNHFAPNYFGKGVRWNLPDLEQSEIAYRMASDAYGRNGRIVVDATREGALRVFPRSSLEEELALGILSAGKCAS